MRVLYLLNVSNSSQLTADSGYTFADLLAPALVDAGAEVTVASPSRQAMPGCTSRGPSRRPPSTGPASTPA